MTLTARQVFTSRAGSELAERTEATAILSADRTADSTTFRAILKQLDLHGVRYSEAHDSEQKDARPCIAVHPDDITTLCEVCQGLRQVKLIRSVHLTSEIQIIVEKAGGEEPRYSVVRVIPACISNTTDQNTRSGVKSGLRRARVWLRPNGVFCVLLGPDGVGKSTTIRRLQLELQTLLGPCEMARWRPGIIRKVEPGSLNRMPHAKASRGSIASTLSLLGLALDFSIGYLVSAYPAMTRSENLIFDRYFHDLLIDPKRYRYAGPMWLPRCINRFIPPRNAIFIILEADEEVILRRKQELPPSELRRQRIAYRNFSSRTPNSIIVNTDKPVDEIVSEIVDKIITILAGRNTFRSANCRNVT
jgi:thymidylate kinase